MSHFYLGQFLPKEESWGSVILGGLCALGLTVLVCGIFYLCA
jgi:hypothetical protein